MKLAWIDFHMIGESVYTDDGEKVDITEQYARTMLANFYACKEKGYAVPILRNHGRDDSWIYGDVVEMRIEGTHLQAGVKFTREAERTAFNEGLMREFSPGFDTDWLNPHTGERVGPTMLELSFCGLGYQRNLRAPQEANPVQLGRSYIHVLSNNKLQVSVTTEPTMAEEKTEVSVEERMTKLEAAVEEIMAKLMESPEEEMMDEPEEEMMVDEEKKEMSRRIQQLEDQLVRTEIAAHGVKEDVDSLVKLARVDFKLFSSTLKKLSRREQTEIGVVGVADTTGTLSASDIAKAAKAAGQTAPTKLGVYLSKQHPTWVARVSEVRTELRKFEVKQ